MKNAWLVGLALSVVKIYGFSQPDATVIQGSFAPLTKSTFSRTAIVGPTQPVSSFSVTSEPEGVFLVTSHPDTGELQIGASPLAEPGRYNVTWVLRSEQGIASQGTAVVLVTAQAAVTTSNRPPVILVNGWQSGCVNPDPDSEATFGRLEPLLRGQGFDVLFFNNCLAAPNQSLEVVGNALRDYISRLRTADGAPVPQVDLIAHSMGGLIVRAMLAGKQVEETVPPAVNPSVRPLLRKVIFLSTPQAGVSVFGLTPDLQTTQMFPGSRFLWDLATWDRGAEFLRGLDALALMGDGGFSRNDDGLVPVVSSSIVPFTGDPQRSRSIPYCHTSTIRFLCQSSARMIAKVDDEQHLSYRAIRSFLAGDTEWQTIGAPATATPALSRAAAVCTAILTADGTGYLPNNIPVSFIPAQGPAVPLSPTRNSNTLCANSIPPGPGQLLVAARSIPLDLSQTRGTLFYVLKDGPVIRQITGTQAGGSTQVLGDNFTTGANPTLMLSGQMLNAQFTNTAANAVLPLGIGGLHQLRVANSQGAHTVNIVVDPGVSTWISQVQDAAFDGATFTPGGWLSVKGLNLSRTMRSWTASDINSGRLPYSLDGVSVAVNGVPAVVSYVSPIQVNALVPNTPPIASLNGEVNVTITSPDGTATATGRITPSAPRFFRLAGGTEVAAIFPDGSVVGPTGIVPGLETRPVRAGDVISLYAAGLGNDTDPVVPYDQIPTAPAPLTVPVSVTAGNTQLQVLWSGLVSPGLYQINVSVPQGIATGSLPLRMVTGGNTQHPVSAQLTVAR